MKMSAAGRKMLAQLEGFKAAVYHDSAGLATIGVGHLLTREELESGSITIQATGREIPWQSGISREDVDAVLEQDLQSHEDKVASLVIVKLQPYQADALISFGFNVGNGALERSTLLKMVNEGKFGAVPDEFRKWRYVTVGGEKREVRGLANRRETEIKCWNGELYPAPITPPPAPLPLPVQTAESGAAAEPFRVAVVAPPCPPTQPTISPRQYMPDRWLSNINPLDIFPRYGTYISIFSALVLFAVDQSGYHIPQWAYALLGAFATARMRRAIDRPTNF